MTCDTCAVLTASSTLCPGCGRPLNDLEDKVNEIGKALQWAAFWAFCAYCIYIATGGH